MSSKSINTLTKQTYIDKNEKRLQRLSDAFFYKRHFLLGEGVDRDEMNFSTIMSSFLCERNCELNKLIKDKIAGKLEPEKDDDHEIVIKKSPVSSDLNITTENFWDKNVEW